MAKRRDSALSLQMQAETMLMVLRNLLKAAHDREQKGEPLVPPVAPAQGRTPMTAGRAR